MSFFINSDGRVCIDTKALFRKVRHLTVAEIEALEERRLRLPDSLNSFEARLAELPVRERRALLALFHTEVIRMLFDFHLSVLKRTTQQKIKKAKNQSEKSRLTQYAMVMEDDLAQFYGLK